MTLWGSMSGFPTNMLEYGGFTTKWIEVTGRRSSFSAGRTRFMAWERLNFSAAICDGRKALFGELPQAFARSKQTWLFD